MNSDLNGYSTHLLSKDKNEQTVIDADTSVLTGEENLSSLGKDKT